MKVTLVDKQFRFSPIETSQRLIAKVEIEVGDDEELMAVLKHLVSLNPKDMIPKSGVQPNPGIPQKLKLAVKEDDIPQVLPFGPIGSLEIE